MLSRYMSWGALVAGFLLVAATSATIVPTEAHAKTKKSEARKSAEAIAVLATADYKKGNYDAASIKFMKAFNTFREPTLIYNAARAKQRAANAARSTVEASAKRHEAIGYFNMYLELRRTKKKGRIAARKHIKSMEAKLAAAEKNRPIMHPAAPAMVIAPREKPGEAAEHERLHNRPSTTTKPGSLTERRDGGKAESPVKTKKAAPTSTAHDQTPPQEAVRTKMPLQSNSNLLTWSAIGGGGALAVGGALVWLEALNKATAANNMKLVGKDAGQKYKNERASAETWQGAGIAMTTLGVAATGFGIWRKLNEPTKSSAWNLAPTMGPDGQHGFVFTFRN